MFKILIVIYIFYINLCYSDSKNISGTKNKTTIEADKVVLIDKKKSVSFHGNVICKNGEITIKSNKMLVNYNNKLSSGKETKIKNIYTDENIIFSNGKMTVTGNKGNYNLKNSIITIEDNVIMNNNDIVVFGEKLTYNTTTDDTKMDGIKNKNNKRVIIILDDIDKFKGKHDNGK